MAAAPRRMQFAHSEGVSLGSDQQIISETEQGKTTEQQVFPNTSGARHGDLSTSLTHNADIATDSHMDTFSA